MLDTFQLAPAAGAGIGKMLAELLLKDPTFIPLMRDVALGCLHASQPRWCPESKTTERIPDFKIQAQMFFGLLAHMEGEPIKRILHQHMGPNGIDTLAAMQDSPALLEAVKREVAKAEFRTRNKKREKVATTVEVEE